MSKADTSIVCEYLALFLLNFVVDQVAEKHTFLASLGLRQYYRIGIQSYTL